uniref:Poly(A) RNA polymerase gld-4 n=1 Tax=Noccaea caerulescens TaxID=107243 RepID=A0A1J3JTD5_NOCCA
MGTLQEPMSLSSSLSLPATVPIEKELWMLAEERAQEILCTIQPVFVSDRTRNEIIKHVQTLVKDRFGIEVYFFGSVPLKTYLPDGDIDLTVLAPHDKEASIAATLRTMLEAKEKDSDFQVTDVQYVPAQVKVIKCRINSISVDISFNQMAGLSALCFLEQVDQKFGKDHLFKRSIILVKAWCYYESRILGANTGLISTYALAILVLNVLNISYSSVSGPLSVLLKFLDYYGSFDWDKQCVTANGPVLISSLPDITETKDHKVFLSEKFFKECMELYTVPVKATEANRHFFPVKHFNILDPLKHSNNLGRSVTKGNMQRIRHAFALGARKLRNVLTEPVEIMGWKLEKFFSNSLDRNGKGQRQDVEEPVFAFGTGRSNLSQLRGDFEGYFKSLVSAKLFHGEIQNKWYVTGEKNGFFWKDLNLSTMMQNMQKSRGTGTYIPEMSQEFYAERFSTKPSTVSATLPEASQTQPLKQNP